LVFSTEVESVVKLFMQFTLFNNRYGYLRMRIPLNPHLYLLN